ncbi:DUF6887 family protein [Scytonema hofmannii]|uniref:DUF6887 family protein n=1 Tax=Scytonema hofmannii TaxID=34078 RepID=UPI000347B13F|nr:hypothetical protein [Scytonema hofmannii]
MIRPNFEQMSIRELRNYVLQHRNDSEALHALGQRIHKEGRRLNSVDELVQIIEEKRAQGGEP